MVGQTFCTILFSNVEGMATISTIPQQQKGSVSKIQVPWTDVMKMYKGMSGVDLIEQRAAAYHFDQKSTIRLYLCGFFFRLDGFSLCKHVYCLQYDASKWSYPARF